VPGYRTLYELPLQALRKLDIPVLNLGPVGKDAHKHTERIHERYAFEVYPALLCKAVLGVVPAYSGQAGNVGAEQALRLA